jgi:hypothetical protein
MGLEWSFDNREIINLNRREMIFEFGDIKVIVPLDPIEGKRYIEPTKGIKIYNLYNMIARMDDYVNPNVDGALSWRIISSCYSYSEEGLEHWQQRMHKVSTRRYVYITRSLHWIGTKLCDPPKYDGLNNIEYLVNVFKLNIPKQQRLLALDVFLKATPARWWATHKERIEDWQQCRRFMQVRFGTEVKYIAQKYIEVGDPTNHVEQCINIWRSIPKKEWTNRFIHTLDTISKNWYLDKYLTD